MKLLEKVFILKLTDVCPLSLGTTYDRRPYGWTNSSFNSSNYGGGGEWKKAEEEFVPNFAFTKKSIRNGFIQKVFSIVAVSVKTLLSPETYLR
jgi:hypothetical protein